MLMEIQASLFFSFWAVISIIFLHLGFNELDKTELSDSVSPAIMSFFKHSFAISTCHSSSYSLIFRPQLEIMVERSYLWVFSGILVRLLLVLSFGNAKVLVWSFVAFSLIQLCLPRVLFFLPQLKFLDNIYFVFLPLLFLKEEILPWYFPIYALINIFGVIPEYNATSQQKVGIRVHMAVEASVFIVGGKTKFYPILVLFVAFYTSVSWAAISGFEPHTIFLGKPIPKNETLQKMLAIASLGKDILSTLREKKKGKLIEFGVGMVGTVLFQSFFRLTTFNHVLAFLYLAVSWLANLTLLSASNDFGVLNFLLNNVIVGCTFNQFGLRASTWLAYGSALALYGLRLKLESLSLGGPAPCLPRPRYPV